MWVHRILRDSPADSSSTQSHKVPGIKPCCTSALASFCPVPHLVLRGDGHSPPLFVQKSFHFAIFCNLLFLAGNSTRGWARGIIDAVLVLAHATASISVKTRQPSLPNKHQAVHWLFPQPGTLGIWPGGKLANSSPSSAVCLEGSQATT